MAEPDLCGTVLDGRYQVIEPIAEGAMGSVYRGERLKLGRAVAIKVMHQELPDELASRQRFEREAKLMALLEHPNCVSVIDFGLHEDKPFLVMDLVRGTSLLQLLDKVGRLEVARAADIIRQVLSGLAHAHELGIVHRDIKPANIMISEKAGLGSQVRILDFGLARIMEGSTKLTTGIVVGTPNYMAPEQCKGSDVDARTDLYACGVMLFEMLTGRKPFVADDPIQVVRKHLMEKPPTLSSVVANADFGELEAVVAKALAKAPGDRYASAVDMAKAVEAAASKATKMSAAALFARAVPDNAPVGSEQATPSGWSLPADAQPSIPLSDSAILPDSAAMSPAAGDQPEPAAPPPVPTAAAATPGAAGPPPVPDAPAAAPGTAGPPPVSDAASAPSTLPPLPQAAPYVPPPPFSTGPSPVVAGSATTGPSPVVAGSATTGPSPIAAPAPGEGGAPEGSMSVPPTRPSAAAHGRITGLPLSKRQLVYAAGGVAALVVIIAIAASGGAKKSAPAKPAVVPEQIEIHPTSEGEVAEALERANALIAAESYEQAVAVLKRARKAHPDNAELAFTSGKANFGRLWWSDGIADFREAIRLDPRYRENPELLKTVLKGFITTPDADERIVGFMREIGPPLRPYLEETAEKHPRKAIRARARAELDARP